MPADADAVLAGVHRLVGFAEQVLGGADPSVSSTTPTLAEIVFGAMIGHGSARTAQIRSTSRPASASSRDDRDEDDELVAAVARDQVVGADNASKPRRDLDEHLVAHVVTERVVDVLEVVEVDEREDRGLARRARLFERVGERAAVEQLRQASRSRPRARAVCHGTRTSCSIASRAAKVPLTTQSTAASNAESDGGHEV